MICLTVICRCDKMKVLVKEIVISLEKNQMSRIKIEELYYTDVEWYGIDRKGNVAVFCSAGVGNVPDYVCADKERYEMLIDFFETLPCISEAQLCFECSAQNNMPLRVAEVFSKKGFYYYDSNDHSKACENVGVYQKYYTISSKPTNPLKYDELPKQIQEQLRDYFLNVDDFGTSNIIEVDDAYNR